MGKFRRHYIKFHDGTTRQRIYPRGTTSEQIPDTEPIFELWRDADDNVIDPPNPELYREDLEIMERADARASRRARPSEEERRKTERYLEERRRSPEYKERQRRAAEQAAEQKGLSLEEYQRYREALKRYKDVELWKPGPARKPQPEDFRGTSP